MLFLGARTINLSYPNSATPESFWLEFSHLDGMCFQMFLDQRREKYPAHLNIIQLENGKFHHSSSLRIPDNILLIFQPPYSPELNLGENMVTHKTRTKLGNL